jgi:hypothetical protein
MTTRKQVVDCARTYIGTPFQHQGRVKGLACDCVGLVYMVADELRLRDRSGNKIDKYEHVNYHAQPTDSFVHSECQRLLIEKPTEQMQTGDVLTLKMPTIPCHVAIVSRLYVGTPNECFGIIHSFSLAGKVVETILDSKTKSRTHGCFSFPEVE